MFVKHGVVAQRGTMPTVLRRVQGFAQSEDPVVVRGSASDSHASGPLHCAQRGQHSVRIGGVSQPVAARPYAATFSLALVEPEQPDRVLLEDERPHLGLDADLVEVLEPSLRRDNRVIGAEQHFVLEQ